MTTDPNAPIHPIVIPGGEMEFHGDTLHIRPDVISNGLTKREHFAAMAMQGILAADPPLLDEIGIAISAVVQADALIAELNKPKVES